MHQEHIVQAARGWLGTRFCHQGRVKATLSHKGGVDCMGLLVGVARELELCCPKGKLLSSYDELNYPHYPDTVRLKSMLGMLLHEIPVGAMQPADILLLNIEGMPQHMGLVATLNGEQSLIHAYAPARAVVEHHLDSWWQRRIAGLFRLDRLF